MTLPRPRRAAIYTRISRDIEGSGLGVERQLQDCEKFAEAKGYEVAGLYSDNDISASGAKRRPDYERMLSDIEAGKIQTVVAWHSDRLHRKTLELERYISLCQTHNVETHTVHAGHLDLSTASGRAVAKILGSIAQQESEQKAERIQRQKQQAAKAGKFLGGRIPWGWQRDGEAIALEPVAARFILAGSKAILEGHSLIEVTRQWADGGAVSLSGTRMNTTQVRRVLLRSRNAGLVTFHGEVVSDGWPPIVTIQQFRAVEAKLNDKSIPRQSAAKFKYLLSGLVLCHCGRYLTGYGAQATAEKPSYRRMYRCKIHQEGGRFVRGHVIREMGKLDKYVQWMIATYLNQEDIGPALLAEATALSASARTSPADTSQLLHRKQELARMFAAGVIEESQLVEGTAQIRAELAEIERSAVSAGGNSELIAVLMSDDPAGGFLRAQIGAQRSIIRAVADVRILAGAKPGAGFNPDLVDFDWKVGR
ncbi:recombinase family protein [Arthrobacter sp. MI7-26]|uniref:recombinase family protein n=1 Tax=Arthrobacter sp. MI7-26 TaxID=2993653 RepID=UPI0022497B32|nr:recombinase family protein [Arthrobacter sp. MI7-26]MCX2747174.1 recombinase family protein [Arthrobacter sp. MI7-26]